MFFTALVASAAATMVAAQQVWLNLTPGRPCSMADRSSSGYNSQRRRWRVYPRRSPSVHPRNGYCPEWHHRHLQIHWKVRRFLFCCCPVRPDRTISTVPEITVSRSPVLKTLAIHCLKGLTRVMCSRPPLQRQSLNGISPLPTTKFVCDVPCKQKLSLIAHSHLVLLQGTPPRRALQVR
jgi:hypothetical protein